MRRKKDDSEKPKEAVWLTTFGDSITLLLTFFVLLFASTSLNKAKVEQIMGALKGSLGVMQSTKESIISPHPSEKKIEQIAKEITGSALSQGLGEDIKVNILPEGLKINLKSPVLFDLGKADLRKEALPLLDKIASILKKTPNDIYIEGHTDNLPIHTEKYPSNWELSAARAVSVGKYFIKKGISPSRIGVEGYADSRPLFPNDTKKHRALNRRVEILILKK